MAYGDRIYARLCLDGEDIIEFMNQQVSSMTELIGELRALTRECYGLCKLYVRNMTRGWAVERPLMIYAERYPTPSGWKERVFGERKPEPRGAADPRHAAGCLLPCDTH